jgi:hypothetical protein
MLKRIMADFEPFASRFSRTLIFVRGACTPALEFVCSMGGPLLICHSRANLYANVITGWLKMPSR